MTVGRFLCRLRRGLLPGLAVLLAVASAALAQEAVAPAVPDAPAPALHVMVAAAHPLAVETGLRVLHEGGSAADAMVAVQLVLGLVEPQSSGLGGGSFLLYYDAARDRLFAYDGRETAPAAVTPTLFLDRSGAPVAFDEAVVGGRPVGTPGVVALMELAHLTHGRLPWARLFEPAIALARQGFPVSPRLAELLQGETADRLRTYRPAADYFFPGGRALRAGEMRDNPAYAGTLEAIAAAGGRAFYEGAIAQDIVDAVRNAAGNPGTLALSDLADYRVVVREPLCHNYRGHRICGMGPPSSGALTVGQILGLLEHFDLASLGPDSVDAWHLFAEASKLAYADRALYIADSDFVPVPVRGLLDPAYLTMRAQAIRLDTALGTPVPAGNPPWQRERRYAPDRSLERAGTSHFCIIDGEGNAVSMTTTIEGPFGSQLMVRGFMLNNELTDFSARPEEQGRPTANRIQPGKRPRSSMAPTMVFDGTGALSLLLGSAGGSRIIAFVAATLIGVIDWNLDLQAAFDQPHAVNRNGRTELEADVVSETFRSALRARGHAIGTVEAGASGLLGIQVTPRGYFGGADRRREGVARGD